MAKKITDDNSPVATANDGVTTVKITDLFDFESCSRCGGSGNHSFCSMYGTTCFKCAGQKMQVTRKHAKMLADYRGAQRAQKEVVLRDIEAGDRISNPFESYQRDGKTYRTWLTVASVEVSPGTEDNNAGWSKSGDGPKRYTGRATVVFTDGRPYKGCENTVLTRQSDFNKVVARCEEKTRAHIRVRYAALVEAAKVVTVADTEVIFPAIEGE